MSKYGTEPYDPDAAYGTGALTEPNAVRTLRVLVLAMLALSLASYALMTVWMLSDAYLDGVLAMYEDFGLPADEAEAAADGAGGAAGAIVSAALMAGLYLVVYFGLRAERNWARILGIVFAIIGIVSAAATGLFSLMLVPYFDLDPLLALSVGLYALHAVLVVWWLVLSFRREVSHYLRFA